MKYQEGAAASNREDAAIAPSQSQTHLRQFEFRTLCKLRSYDAGGGPWHYIFELAKLIGQTDAGTEGDADGLDRTPRLTNRRRADHERRFAQRQG